MRAVAAAENRTRHIAPPCQPRQRVPVPDKSRELPPHFCCPFISPKADIQRRNSHVRFSNRPFGVKHFQTIRRCSVDVAHGLVLLFGIGTRALPSWDSKTRWNNLMGGLAVSCRQVQATCELTSSIVPRGTSFHRWVD